jgi:hypothetical protein
MTNILPQEYKKQIRREYRLRLLSTVFMLMFWMVVGATTLLIPSYLMSGSVESTFKGQLEGFPDLSADEDELRGDLANTRDEIVSIKHISEQSTIESTVRMLVSLTPSSVALTRIALNEGGVGKGSVSGIATARGDLQFFVDRLRDEDDFENVELPVSDLAQGSNIPFSITFTLRESALAEEPSS